MKYILTSAVTLAVVVMMSPLSLSSEPMYYKANEAKAYYYDIELFEESEEVEKLEESIYCSCIKTARELGADIPIGTNAWDLEPNTSRYTKGVLILLQYDSRHVAVITELADDGIHVSEGNFRKCEATNRVIDYDSPEIIGFWTPDKHVDNLALSL